MPPRILVIDDEPNILGTLAPLLRARFPRAFVDPNRDLIAIAMTQCADFLFNGTKDRFRQAVYQATA